MLDAAALHMQRPEHTTHTFIVITGSRKKMLHLHALILRGMQAVTWQPSQAYAPDVAVQVV